jgi:hypothetical protein
MSSAKIVFMGVNTNALQPSKSSFPTYPSLTGKLKLQPPPSTNLKKEKGFFLFF